MSTTEAGRLTASGGPDGQNPPGVSLQAVIEARRRLDELSCARVVGNLAAAVHAAQKGGQPLGTLAPAAVLVLPDGSVKLTTGAASLPYTAPEKLRGTATDRRTDVFALGVMLWEALAHERLFGGANEDAIKQAVLAFEFRPPSELNANVPAELDAICKKALARDPSDRYQSAKVMAAEIDAVLDDAGYPETNDQIATYVAGALAPEAPAAAPKSPVLPSIHPANPAGQTPGQPPGQPPARPAPLSSVLSNTPGGTLPPPAFIPRQGPTEVVASLTARAGTAPAKSAKTEILGSLSPVGAPSPADAKPDGKPDGKGDRDEKPSTVGAVTALLGSNASAGTAAISFAPPEMPAPAASAPAAPVTAPIRSPELPVHPQPPNKPSIASAETIATPHLPPQLAPQLAPSPPSQPAGPPAPPQLAMPPGMTVQPSSPGAPLQSADQEPAGERPAAPIADPIEVVALRPAQRAGTGGTGGRDVLAGWGWATGSVEAIDDEDMHDTARASRKRLLIAIGGALGVVIVIAILALAFGGSKEGASQDPRSGVAPPSGVAKPSEVAAAPAVAPPGGTGPAPAAAPPPASPEPPRPEPAAPPPASEPPAAEPARAEPPAAEPATATPPASEPAKVAAAAKAPEPVKAEPPAAEPVKPEPAKKLEAKKPSEAKKSSELKKPPGNLRRTTPSPPDKLQVRSTARAQPVDPYAASAEKPGADPAAAYRTGLQQFARGDTQGALSTLRTSLASNPTFAPTWRGLGLVYEKLGEKSQARSAFKRYLQLAPGAGDAGQIRERLERL